ncbi:MAG: hypothetical protein A2091_03555 [Desulfuromonadales bacterium GWD2_61_12]|nr:MAG: hypothetical protein A2091_03555 [Desulfuromonadales bacterium GWD2_61_12]OGR33517.1 MAG: hypothetical protein A2005_08120 [Desulfuromonadales bacterium GWC2_61_20]HAD03226.1 hypothetical protein [Desulfuromonas sp.]HBT83110.1 hypothetical protein [Desulfuromonas sp.]
MKKRNILLPLLAGLALALPAQVLALGTPAETAIVNTASISYDIGVTPVTQTSNTVTITVGEILDVTLTWLDVPNVLVKPGDVGQMLTFQLSNTGNYSEIFNLSLNNTVGGDQFDPIAPTTIYLDSNGNNTYDAGVDTLHVAGTNDPTLTADGAITLFVFNAIPGDPGGPLDGDTAISRLSATAATGSGAPGSAFPGAGGSGTVAAVVGLSGGSATDDGIYEVSRFDLVITKSAVINDTFGGNEPLPGATISYTIDVVVTGTGSGTNLAITDTIDADVVYAAGTLALDTVPLSDTPLNDAGEVVAGVVTVRLGNVTAPATHAVTFDVTIP